MTIIEAFYYIGNNRLKIHMSEPDHEVTVGLDQDPERENHITRWKRFGGNLGERALI